MHSKIVPEYEENRIIIFCLISNKLVLGCPKLLCKLCFSRKRLEKSPVRAYLYWNNKQVQLEFEKTIWHTSHTYITSFALHYPHDTVIHWESESWCIRGFQVFTSFYGFPETVFRRILKVTWIYFSFDDAPKVFDVIEVHLLLLSHWKKKKC